jgi:hypothetical protein
MRVIEKTVFTFDELNDKAKETARDWYRENMDFGGDDESKQSIDAFCGHFSTKLINWSIGAHSPYSFDIDAPHSLFRGLKLKDVNRDAMPTGYCLDCTLWFTFYDEFKRTGNAYAAFVEAIDQAFRDWRNDLEAQLEDEAVDENILRNEYEFTEDGGMA